MYCRRCGDIVYGDRCKKCGGRPVESTTGGAAVHGGRKDPWSSTYLERRFNPGNGSASASCGSGANSSASPRPVSTVYSPRAGMNSHNEVADFSPSHQYRELKTQRSSTMLDAELSGSPTTPTQLAVAARNDRLANLKAQQLKESPRARPVSMYASSGIFSPTAQKQTPSTRADNYGSQTKQYKSPVLAAVAAKSRMSHLKGLSPSSSTPNSNKPRWSQYYTGTSPTSTETPTQFSGRVRSETFPSVDTNAFNQSQLVHNSTKPPPNVIEKTNPSKQNIAAAAAGIEAATMAHTQLSKQEERRRSANFNTKDLGNLAHNDSLTENKKKGIEYTSTGLVDRSPETQAPYSRGIQYPSRVIPLESQVTHIPDTRNANSAFAHRTYGVARTDNTNSRVGSRLGSIEQPLRSRSATLPDSGSSGEQRACTTCGKLLRVEEQRQFASKPGVIYCTNCYHSSYSRGFCAGCNKIVLTHGRPWVQYGDKIWHKLCIKCHSCNKLLLTPLVDLDSMPVCESCFSKSGREINRTLIPKDPTPPSKPATSINDLKTQPPSIMEGDSTDYQKSSEGDSPSFSARERYLPSRSCAEIPIPTAIGGAAKAIEALAFNGMTRDHSKTAYEPRIPPRPDDSITQPVSPSTQSQVSLKDKTIAFTNTKITPSPDPAETGRMPSSLINNGKANANTEHHNSTEHRASSELSSGQSELRNFASHKQDSSRIMSPVEIAEKEGLPMPPPIQDPELSAISRSESQATAVELTKHTSTSPVPASRPTCTNSRMSSPQFSNRSSPTPRPLGINTNSNMGGHRLPLSPVSRSPFSPSLKKPSLPAPRTPSSRSVSFMIDGAVSTTDKPVQSEYEADAYSLQHDNSDNDEHKLQDTQDSSSRNVPSASNESQGTLNDSFEEPSPEESELYCVNDTGVSENIEKDESLAEYALNKANTKKSNGRFPSVADTIKKFSAGTFLSNRGSSSDSTGSYNTSKRQQTVSKAQLPGLKDIMRTHQCETPKTPTIPSLDKHNKLLKSRPRNNNRRRPSHAPELSSAATDSHDEADSIQNRSVPRSGYDNCQVYNQKHELHNQHHEQTHDQEQCSDPESFIPNSCARCTKPIDDTWFRLSDGRQVHVECFTCCGCGELIDDGVYVLETGTEYHPACVPPSPPIVSVSPVPSAEYVSTDTNKSSARPLGPRAPRQDETCDRCHGILSGPRFHLSNGKRYHPDCFACAGCGQRFDEGSYVCYEGLEYHHQCVSKYASESHGNGRNSAESQLVCGECNQIIEGVFVRHNDCAFHPNCFFCHDCRKVITPNMPFGEVENGNPCCESCINHRLNSNSPQGRFPQEPIASSPAHNKIYCNDSGTNAFAS